VSTADAVTVAGGPGFVLEESVPAPGTRLAVEDRLQAGTGPAAATMTFDASDAWAAILGTFKAAVVAPPPVPDLTVTKTHGGAFTQGQTGATYTLTATNSGTGPTVGTVTVTDTLPASGLTATGLSGTGWSCTLGTLTCTRSDTLAAGGSYPAITLTVNVASNAPASVTNTAAVSGGGETNAANDTASDPTTVNAATTGPPVSDSFN